MSALKLALTQAWKEYIDLNCPILTKHQSPHQDRYHASVKIQMGPGPISSVNADTWCEHSFVTRTVSP